jgi:nicotinamide riboside kinase
MAMLADSMLFCDTDLHVIKIWSEHKYGHTDPWIAKEIARREYHLYLLTDIDMPWEADPQREYPDPVMRKYFYEWYERILKDTRVPLVKITGSKEKRLDKAYRAVQEMLG